ncbi:MAG: 30S ribosomal protein S18 [Candidatus Hydrogenedentota bacterium]
MAVIKKKKKVCYFCREDKEPDYKDISILERFISDRGRIVPRRINGVCARHQRKLTRAVKRARCIALAPFTTV